MINQHALLKLSDSLIEQLDDMAMSEFSDDSFFNNEVSDEELENKGELILHAFLEIHLGVETFKKEGEVVANKWDLIRWILVNMESDYK